MTEQQIEYCNGRFLIEKNQEIEFINDAKRIIPINQYLEKFNWALFHPYLRGGLMDYFENLMRNNCADKKKVFTIYAKYFFDLRQTAAYIDGFFKKRHFLQPFCQVIDQSVFMCLQKDYAGAITVLLPVVEGSIRLYLLNGSRIKHNSKINQKELIKSFEHVKEDFRSVISEYYHSEYAVLAKRGVCYSEDQINELIGYRCVFFDTWVDPLHKYIDKNFYFEFGKNEVKDRLSRNVIFHGVGSDRYYNLENYLKIFNCILYISYVFGTPDLNSKIWLNVELEDIIYKWRAFEKIRAISNLTLDIKSSVYKTYTDFDIDEFNDNFVLDELEDHFSKVSKRSVEKKLHSIDSFFDKLMLGLKQQK